MRPQRQLPVEISYLRIVAQLLVPGRHKHEVTDVVSHMLAMQGQQVSSFPHAVLARTTGTTIADVRTACDDRLLVRHRPMRGTVHLTHARDYHWLRLTLRPPSRNTTWQRHEEAAGASEAVMTEAAHIAYDLLAEHPEGIRRRDLFTAWTDAFDTIRNETTSPHRFAQFLMWGLDRRGALVEGPLRSNEHLFIDARSLPAADSAESGWRYHTNDDDRQDALAEIAYRYVRGHGPIFASDFARWISSGQALARQALDAAVAHGTVERYRITDEGLAPWASSCSPADTMYMEPDLLTQVSAHADTATNLMFLPAFDELHVGYGNRTCLTDEAGETLICPAKNGMFKPIVIHQGRLIAVCTKEGPVWHGRLTARQRTATHDAINHMRQRMALPDVP